MQDVAENGLIITEQSRSMCRLINVLTESRGRDISFDIEIFIKKGASVDILIPPYTYDNGFCDDDDYDDFLPHPDFEPPNFGRWYYPLSFAVNHYCKPNVIRILHAYSQKSPKRDLIYEELKETLKERFGQLYRSPYFMKKAADPESYFHGVKCLADEYLQILGLDASIFDTLPPYKFHEIDPRFIFSRESSIYYIKRN